MAKFDGVKGGDYARGMRTKVSADGSVEIPAKLRRKHGIKPGQCCEIDSLGSGILRVKVVDEAKPKRRLIDVLLSCPVKGWYKPLERRETTADFWRNPFE